MVQKSLTITGSSRFTGIENVKPKKLPDCSSASMENDKNSTDTLSPITRNFADVHQHTATFIK